MILRSGRGKKYIKRLRNVLNKYRIWGSADKYILETINIYWSIKYDAVLCI
jgi:hypothetical protein